ncbi:hypothetical protein [Zavarzinella formosa]|uniref:hypothetical protein n=1 Tax=Zavarzinella formosa TaxID=360055 RepID=UPI00031C00B4|nr:hypothetical protein [Zavarzinella formosa]
MRLIGTLVLATLALGSFGFAEDKKEPAEKSPVGTFKRSAGDLALTITLKKDHKLDFIVVAGEASGTLECKYTMDKEGAVKCEVENFIKKGDFPVTKEKGYKFSFKMETKKTAIVLSNFDGDDVDEAAKKAIEGEYVAETK